MAIRYLEQRDIDCTLWDRCIHQSFNDEVYNFSWFLDVIAGTWDTLLEYDYCVVMPLIYRPKLMYRIVYRNPPLKHLGIFSGLPVRSEQIMVFLKNIPGKFRKVDIPLNRQNTQALNASYSGKEYVYEIPSSKRRTSYSGPVRQAIDLAEKRKFSVMKQISLSELEILLHESTVIISESLIITPLLRALSRMISGNKAEVNRRLRS